MKCPKCYHTLDPSLRMTVAIEPNSSKRNKKQKGERVERLSEMEEQN